ncbi:UNVERIFIED_CONTAM: hypothetical protein RKD50_009341 [Streptomyces canus]
MADPTRRSPLRHHAWALASGQYPDVMSERRQYPSDLPDAHWELIQPVLAAWQPGASSAAAWLLSSYP